ncbi:hypothetical protein ACWEQG_35885 [Microbispora sp. NPDC004025]
MNHKPHPAAPAGGNLPVETHVREGLRRGLSIAATRAWQAWKALNACLAEFTPAH